MSADWVIDLSERPWQPSAEQRALLDALEAAIPTRVQSPHDQAEAVTAVAPIVRALADSGMTATQIADHSRIHPRGVAMILNGAADAR